MTFFELTTKNKVVGNFCLENQTFLLENREILSKISVTVSTTPRLQNRLTSLFIPDISISPLQVHYYSEVGASILEGWGSRPRNFGLGVAGRVVGDCEILLYLILYKKYVQKW